MSTRYVWNQYAVSKKWSASPEAAQFVPIPTSGNGYFSSGYVGSGISDNDFFGNRPVSIQGGKVLTSQTLTPVTASYSYYTPFISGNSLFAWAQSGNIDTGYSWYVQPNPSGEGWTLSCTKDGATSNIFYRELVEKKGELLGSVSSGVQNTYPTTSGGAVSGDNWYVYQGADSIDPTAVSYSSNPQAGKTVTVTVTSRSNTYGGTIYYQYQYSTNGGTSWTDAGAKISDTSKSITIPAGATQFRSRVLASDNMGFTSTTYVTGTNVSLNSAPTAPASVTVPHVVAPGQKFTISWEASTDPDGNLSGYQVEMSYNGGSTWTSVDSAVNGTSLDTTVTAGNTAVLFRVRAFDSGGLYSGWTVSQNAEINQPPTVPEELALDTVVYGDYADLAWTAATDQDGSIASYTLQRAVNGGAFETVYTGSALTYTDQTENWTWTTVQYRVQAQDDRGSVSGWTTSPQRQIQPGTLSITGDPENPGQVVKSFTFAVSVSASGKFPVSGILVVIALDSTEKIRTTVSSGGKASLPVSIEELASGSHTITVIASRDKFTAATRIFNFTVVPIELGAGGRLERLENVQGQPVYPIAILEGIFRKRDGKSLEAILSDLNSGGGESDLNIRATAETLPAGNQASVTVTQTESGLILHFGIPEGAKGETGASGTNGADGAPGPAGADGKDGKDGEGVPTGGAPGQVLAKRTAADYDTQWIDLPEDGGGTVGVSSFNGRSGAVAPKAGDYTAEMVGARPSNWMPTAADVGAIPAESVKAVQALTEEEYNALAAKSATTLYAIKE